MIIIPDLFTPYLQGQRQAVADNWTDLLNSEKLREGQLKNEFREQTFMDKLAQEVQNTAQAELRTATMEQAVQSQGLRLALEQARQSGNVAAAEALSRAVEENADALARQKVQTQQAANQFATANYDAQTRVGRAQADVAEATAATIATPATIGAPASGLTNLPSASNVVTAAERAARAAETAEQRAERVRRQQEEQDLFSARPNYNAAFGGGF